MSLTSQTQLKVVKSSLLISNFPTTTTLYPDQEIQLVGILYKPPPPPAHVLTTRPYLLPTTMCLKEESVPTIHEHL